MNQGKKKILIFSIAYRPFVGGAEIAVSEVTKRLVGSGEFSFDLLTANLDGKQKNEENVEGVNVFRLSGGKLFFPFAALMAARNLHGKNHYDAVWAIMANRAGFAALFFKFLFPKVPLVLTLQEGDLPDYAEKRMGILRPILMPLFRMIFRKADKVTAISNYLAEWGRKMGARNVEVVPNGVEAERFKIQDSRLKKEEMRKEFGFLDSDMVLVTTSRLVPKNGVGDIIEALRYLPGDIKLIIVGTGYLEYDLKLKVQNEKLEDRVRFNGFVPPEKLPPYLWASDIFVRPSLSEGMGNSFIEAMAAGLPIVGTPVGGIPDFLKDGETGLFCEVNNPQSIAEKIKLLQSDLSLREKIVKNALRLVFEKYGWSAIASRFKEILKV